MTARAQLERMLAMVPYLHRHQGIAIADVAAQFAISEAQARREVLALMLTGTGSLHGEMLDLDLDSFDEGIIHLRNAEFMSRPLRVTPSEGAALVVALGVLRQLATSDLTPIIDRATAKLEEAIGTVQPAIEVHVEAADTRVRDAIDLALQGSRQLAIVHASDHTDRRTERTVDPLAIMSERGHLYLSAWCHRAEDHRLFRLDRILHADVLDTPAMEHSTGASESLFTPGPDTPYAILDVSASGRWLVEAHQAEVLIEREDRSWRVKVHGIDHEWLRRLVIRGGGSMKVVEPESLRIEVTETVSAALGAYDG